MQDENFKIITLLTEMRGAQREHLLAYKEQSERAISLQLDATRRYARYAALTKFVLLPLLVILVGYLVYLGQKFLPFL